LLHHPQVAGHAFKPAYDRIHWEHGRHADALFDAWCQGRTGYPLVDAAMHQINQTKIRVTAVFVAKFIRRHSLSGKVWFGHLILCHQWSIFAISCLSIQFGTGST
jgi:deoxyribodipyrimidine photo-lyase